ncbi:MAG: lysophospholipid acyltransferase family protein [Verrucomicrobiota bacterium]
MNPHPFKLNLQPGWRWAKKPAASLTGLVEHCIQLDQLNRVYASARRQAGGASFVQKVLRVMNVNYIVTAQDRTKIPRTGAAIVVANHPFGMIEGLVLSDILQQVRPDARILANYLLGRIPEMRDQFIFVDPFKGKHSTAANIKPMKECLQWMRGGGILGVFPAGEVAHLDWRTRSVQDPSWTWDIARLVRHTQSPVVPFFFEGANGPLFQLAGIVHPRLRTAMLPHEFMNKQHLTIRVHIGTPVPFKKSGSFTNDGDLVEYLRLRTCLLFHRGQTPGNPRRRFPRIPPGKMNFEPLAEAVPTGELAAEVAALPLEQNLVQANEYAVYYARAVQIPRMLREIGRLRELTFRKANEGSGHALDLDRFDHHYLHLFIWHVPKGELVGAYRMGQADLIMRQSGIRGLYSSTLFKYDQRLMEHLNPALEMGRSFIRPEYQRAYYPLFLLWKGIGAYIVRNPHYISMFGPVSMNNKYQAASRQLMVRFLEHNYFDYQIARLVKPRNPLPAAEIRYCDQRALRNTVTSIEDISALIADIEQDRQGMPILFKQYIKFGGRLLAFNLDPAFSYVLDGLFRVDLRKTSPTIMLKYMGAQGYARWQEYQARNPQGARSTDQAQDIQGQRSKQEMRNADTDKGLMTAVQPPEK